MLVARPEVGASVWAGGIRTNFLESGAGPPVVLIHGSGPGVSAYANWRLTIPALAQHHRVIAPDLVGFGFTDRPPGVSYGLATWTDHLLGFLDAVGLERVSVVGNSFGGALALWLATEHPERVERLVLMGSVGVAFPLTEGLDYVWGYQPSPAHMRQVLDYFVFNQELINDELAAVRYRASIEPGFQESFSSMFPAPRQRWVDGLVIPDDRIAAIAHETLVVHGREDQVIPLANAYRLLQLLPAAQLHVFGRCGHWTQIERSNEFNSLVSAFLQG